MATLITDRINALRAWMAERDVQAFIVPSTDPHLSEYVAPHWKSREWISGFTGSAGTVVVTNAEAGLWTDSRYFLQAERQLAGSSIGLYKEALPETPTITRFLCERLKPGEAVGIDGKMFSVAEVERMKEELTGHGIEVRPVGDPMDELWADRPAMPQAPAYVYPLAYAGQSCEEKIEKLRAWLKEQHADGLLLSALDEIAWTLNLRGSDVHCNPVFVSYLLVTADRAVCFVSPQKITPEVAAYLTAQQVDVQDYAQTEACLNRFDGQCLVLDPAKTNYAIRSAVNPACRVQAAGSPVALLKAVRNDREIEGLHAAMLRDGVALVKFLRWLEEAVPAGKETERSVAQKLHELRAEQPLYRGESFDTIAGYKEHGAIVHYTATPETDATLRPEGFLLLDSGAQYLDGTTDITRTIALGPLTEEEATDYTLVLKGHIALATARFPVGTRGAQIDVLARMPLWQHRMNYLHGTGHGVGHFLCVHEGPQSIRTNENPVALLPGMVTSNEPGVYKAGNHGIRTENLTLVCRDGEGMFGDYCRFETLTLCPICKKGIRKELLSPEETEWLDSYHRRVYELLAPHLAPEEKTWLRHATAPL